MEHYYNTIQNWFDYERVFKLAIDTSKDGDHFVEIGVWKGGSTSFMGVEIFNSNKKIIFDAIDSFAGSNEHGDVSDWLFDEASKNLKPLTDIGIVNLIKGYSLDIVNTYKDESIDFCFIDASHEYNDVKADLIAWLPKVKKGGILAGHDYDRAWQGVISAVDEVIGKDKISTIGSSFIYYKK
jgi:predicted O-methyltransferase YrrM